MLGWIQAAMQQNTIPPLQNTSHADVFIQKLFDNFKFWNDMQSFACEPKV